ncbi:MAG TPA: hypothetical protein ENI99_08820 [Sedimenticola sp.]|nr:hypothetical protein [Sedimenticola sp.]
MTDLLEAEGRALKHSAVRTAVAMACVAVAGVLALVGIGFCLWAGYQYLALVSGPIAASLICGLVIIAVAGGFAWLTSRLLR